VTFPRFSGGLFSLISMRFVCVRFSMPCPEKGKINPGIAHSVGFKQKGVEYERVNDQWESKFIPAKKITSFGHNGLINFNDFSH